MNKETDILSRLRKISELDDVLWIAKVREIILSIHENEKIKLFKKFEPFAIMRTLSDCMDFVVKELDKNYIYNEVGQKLILEYMEPNYKKISSTSEIRNYVKYYYTEDYRLV